MPTHAASETGLPGTLAFPRTCSVPQHGGELTSCRGELRWIGTGPGDDDDVDRLGRTDLELPIGFSDDPLPAIAHDGVTDALAGGDSEATTRLGSGPDEDDEMACVLATTSSLHGEKLPALPNTGAPGEAVWRRSSATCHFEEVETAMAFRPFRRRAFKTRRPPFVAILARKPWVRLRLRLLGWNVRLVMVVLPQKPGQACSIARGWVSTTEWPTPPQ